MPKGRSSSYKHIEQSLRSRVREGHWSSGQVLPGRRKLAEEYGVALSTMQRAVANLVEDGTLETDGNLGTFVASQAGGTGGGAPPQAVNPGARPGPRDVRSLPSSNLQVSILMDRTLHAEHGETFDDQFFGPLFSGMRSVLARENVYVSYVYRNGRSLLDVYGASGSDGLIAVTPITSDVWDLKTLHDAQVPFVAVLTTSDALPGYTDLPCVDADNRRGAAEAVEHLVALGHERIGTVNLAMSLTDLNDRFLAYLDVLTAAGLMADPAHMLVSAAPWNEPLIQERIGLWVDTLVRRHNLPTAIFTGDLAMTMHTLAALQRHGVRIPEDVSLVGFDDTAAAAHMTPPLTLVRQPVYQIGSRAATRLVDHLRHSRGPLTGCERLPTQLIIRASTGRRASPDGAPR